MSLSRERKSRVYLGRVNTRCVVTNQLKHKHGAAGNVCYEGLVSAGIYWVFSEVVGGMSHRGEEQNLKFSTALWVLDVLQTNLIGTEVW